MFNEVEFKKMIVACVLEALQQMPLTTNVQAAPTAATEKKYLYSIKDLAALLNCSTVTAMKLKQSGKIPFRQLGRKCIFDTDAVLGAMHTNKGRGATK